VLLGALHVLSPEFSPSWRMVSEYAFGHHARLLSLMFLCWGIGSWALAVAIWNEVHSAAGKVGLWLLILAGIGEAMASIFDIRHEVGHGIAGLLGAGRTETLEVLFGLHPGTSGGEVRIEGEKIRLLNPVDAKAAGIALVTEDRKRDGLVLGAGIDRNAELAVLRTIAAFGLVSPHQELELADRTIRNLGIQASGPRQLAGTLSGGNQQKLVIGKWLLTKPRVLLLDEPTRGIDVGAKAEIYRLIGTLAEQGLAMVLVSSELPELTLLSDRILVLCEGRPTALLSREQFSHETILEYASPGGSMQPAFAEMEVAR